MVPHLVHGGMRPQGGGRRTTPWTTSWGAYPTTVASSHVSHKLVVCTHAQRCSSPPRRRPSACKTRPDRCGDSRLEPLLVLRGTQDFAGGLELISSNGGSVPEALLSAPALLHSC